MILIDTNFVVALTVQQDINHQAAVQALKRSTGVKILPSVVLEELFYVLLKKVGYRRAVEVLDTVMVMPWQIEEMTPVDRKRMVEIMRKYESARLDYVDCAIMALSERLKITRVATFDHRDFSIFRPQHCAALELIPSE